MDECIFNFDEVWGRIRQVTGWKRYGEMAAFLKIRPASLSGAKARGTMPMEWAFQVARSHQTSTDWILTGDDPRVCSGIDLFVHVAQIVELVHEGRETKLGWEAKGKLLGVVFKKVRLLGLESDDEKIKKIVFEYLEVFEIAKSVTCV